MNPSPSASVILIREHEQELQTYLLRRSGGAGFFPGYYVFPGGSLDREDKNPGFWMNYVDMDGDEIFRNFGGDISAEEALGYCIAGIRETFEEAGVLIALNRDKAIPKKACENRLADGLSKRWLQDLVISEGWKLNLIHSCNQ